MITRKTAAGGRKRQQASLPHGQKAVRMTMDAPQSTLVVNEWLLGQIHC